MAKTELTKKIERTILNIAKKNSNIIGLPEYRIKTPKFTIIFDVLLYNISDTFPKLVGHEIKISEQDFLKLRTKLNEDFSYLDYCDQFYVVIPETMLTFVKEQLNKGDLEKYIGIKTYNEEENTLMIRQKINKQYLSNGELMRNGITNQIDRHILEYVAKTDLNILSENIGENND